MQARRGIFLDCGGHDGCSVIQFLSLHPGFRCITFEPNPVFESYYRYLPTELVKKAVSTSDGKVQFVVDPIDGDGSSICAGKDVVYDGSMANENCPVVTVDCVDLSGFIGRTVQSEDYLCLKLDVEGAEYEILAKMLRDGTIGKVKELYCEFHWKKCGVSRESHNRLVSELRKHTTVSEWNAGPYAIHTLGLKSKVRRALILAKLWPRHLLGSIGSQA